MTSKQTYYIDPRNGSDDNAGISPNRPLKTYTNLDLLPGDTVRFKRGSVIRDMLQTRNGTEGAPITYGAYGEGPKPAFLGSVAADHPECWVEERPSIWRYTGELPSEVCNLIFNDGESCGNLRYALEDLRHPGEWHYTSVGATSAGSRWQGPDPGNAVLHLCSPVNPAEAYRNIECALWGRRTLVIGESHVVLDGLSFRNSGVHGYHAVHPHNVVIRNCDFRFIGGAVHTLDCRVRFGNGVELWDGARDVTVEHCVFDNIFDAGVTHQGGETRNIPERVYFRNNLFIDCGLAAYEFREPAQDIYFEYNTCINSGGGFHMQGNPPPRESAISVRVRNNKLVEMVEWPTSAELEAGDVTPIDVGHHVFVWRIDRGTQPGPVYIRNNVFYETPYGAAFYAVIHPEDLRHFVLDGNTYWQTTGELLAYMSGRGYCPDEFARYQADWGQDKHSKIARPVFIDEAAGDYRQTSESPCVRQCGCKDSQDGRPASGPVRKHNTKG